MFLKVLSCQPGTRLYYTQVLVMKQEAGEERTEHLWCREIHPGSVRVREKGEDGS